MEEQLKHKVAPFALTWDNIFNILTFIAIFLCKTITAVSPPSKVTFMWAVTHLKLKRRGD